MTKAAVTRSRRGRCSHSNRIEAGQTYEGMGRILVYWCPDCGGLKRTMTNWKYTNYRWRLPLINMPNAHPHGTAAPAGTVQGDVGTLNRKDGGK